MIKEPINTNAGASQCDRILARLREARGAEVPMPELARIGAGNADGFCMVHSRIADLRRLGHDIPPARVKRSAGRMHSFYRLKEFDPSTLNPQLSTAL